MKLTFSLKCCFLSALSAALTASRSAADGSAAYKVRETDSKIGITMNYLAKT